VNNTAFKLTWSAIATSTKPNEYLQRKIMAWFHSTAMLGTLFPLEQFHASKIWQCHWCFT